MSLGIWSATRNQERQGLKICPRTDSREHSPWGRLNFIPIRSSLTPAKYREAFPLMQATRFGTVRYRSRRTKSTPLRTGTVQHTQLTYLMLSSPTLLRATNVDRSSFMMCPCLQSGPKLGANSKLFRVFFSPCGGPFLKLRSQNKCSK